MTQVAEADVIMDGNYYRAWSHELRSIDLGKPLTYKLHNKTTGEDVESTCCALSWCYDYQNNAQRGMFCKAMYLYYVAAMTVFNLNP